MKLSALLVRHSPERFAQGTGSNALKYAGVRRGFASATSEEKSNALSLRTIILVRQEFAGFVLGKRGTFPCMNSFKRTVGEWLYRHANPDDFTPGSPKHLKLMAVLMTIALALLLPK